MRILVIGGAGMVGRKLIERLAREGRLGASPITALTAHDVVAPARIDAPFPIEARVSDLSVPGEAAALLADRPDVIFHLAAIVSGEAEMDFEKGYRINLDGTRFLFDAVRAIEGYCPRLVFTSSIAVFGAPFPEAIGDDFFHTPLTSYGTQKAICELLLADYSRRGFFDGVGIRLPHHLRAPGQAQQSGVRLLLLHHPRAAGGPGGGAAGLRRGDALARLAAFGPRASSSMRRCWTRRPWAPGATSPCRGLR